MVTPVLQRACQIRTLRMVSTLKIAASQYALLFLSLIFLSSPALASSSADDNTGRDAPKTYRIYKDVELVSTLKFEYDKPRVVIKSVYPQLQTDLDQDTIEAFNESVLELVAGKISEYKMQVAENQETQKLLPKGKFKNDLYIDFAASFIQSGKNPILSIRFSTQGLIAGMAHPYHHYFVLNYDLRNDDELELEDLFLPDSPYLDVISHYTRQRLQKRLRDNDMIIQGTAANADNFKNWNIKPNGLLITFDEYQVAPYVDGAQTVLVPFSVLKELIDPESPLADCLVNKKRCSRSNVVTGGFIDEARNRSFGTQKHLAAR